MSSRGDDISEQAIRGVPWTLVSYGASKGITVASTIVLAHLLAPSDFGLMALAIVVVSFVNLLGGLGLGNVIVVRQDAGTAFRGTVVTLLIGTGAVFAAAIALLAHPIADAFEAPRLADVLPVLSVFVLVSGVNWFYEIVLMRELEFRRRFVAIMVQALSYAVPAITLAALGAGVWSLVVGVLLGSTAYAIALLWLAPYRVRPAFNLSDARAAVTTGRGFLLQGATAFLQHNADYFAVGRILGTAQLGFYSMAYRLSELPYLAIADPISKVTFPSFARMRHLGEDIAPGFLSALRLVALVTCPVGIILSASARPFVEAVLGQNWRATGGALSVLGLWAAIRPVEVTAGWLLNALGQATSLGLLCGVLLVPAIPLLFAAAHWGGIAAVAWVVLGHMVVTLVGVCVLVQRRVGIALTAQWRALQPVVIAAIPAWIAARAVADGLQDSTAFLALVASAAAALAAYAAVLWLAEPDLPRDVRGYARRAFSRLPAGAAS